jgi:tripartite-type tricarboxylate transporter receptor subunit TctC
MGAAVCDGGSFVTYKYRKLVFTDGNFGEALFPVVIVVGWLLVNAPTRRRSPSPSSEGKSICIIVSSIAWGGYDVLAKTSARHWSKYFPSNPHVIAQNMPSAGGLVGANYLFKLAKRDGMRI